MSLGLLECAFNISIATKDFLQTGLYGRKVVQTAYIRDWIDGFHSRAHGLKSSYHDRNVDEQKQQRERLVRSVEHAIFWNQRLFEIESEEESGLSTNSDVF